VDGVENPTVFHENNDTNFTVYSARDLREYLYQDISFPDSFDLNIVNTYLKLKLVQKAWKHHKI
jgi:hypothetical protein